MSMASRHKHCYIQTFKVDDIWILHLQERDKCKNKRDCKRIWILRNGYALSILLDVVVASGFTLLLLTPFFLLLRASLL